MDTTEDFYKQYFTDEWFRTFAPSEQNVIKSYFDKMMNEYSERKLRLAFESGFESSCDYNELSFRKQFVDSAFEQWLRLNSDKPDKLSCVVKLIKSIGEGVVYKTMAKELAKEWGTHILFTGTHSECHKFMIDNSLPKTLD